VRGIIELGRSVGLRVMAEGMENHDQWQALQQAGCKIFQGYFFDHLQFELEAQLIDRLRKLQPVAP
jgi:EAL domain-containing protein (putative c-di-GMP-specific phosphodiesterase class I)